MRIEDLSEDEGEYIDLKDCIASGRHLLNCDDDGYCNLCGEQDSGDEPGAEFAAGKEE